MTTWTNISKASGTSYTRVSGGHILYNDPITIYDSSTVTYDGLSNQSGWTNISKASGTAWTKIAKAS